jgi:plasmid maintenance system killer protein
MPCRIACTQTPSRRCEQLCEKRKEIAIVKFNGLFKLEFEFEFLNLTVKINFIPYATREEEEEQQQQT